MKFSADTNQLNRCYGALNHSKLVPKVTQPDLFISQKILLEKFYGNLNLMEIDVKIIKIGQWVQEL